ncbi:hypothetical protein BD626DRAFT_406026 [Schizophyllum amplum]|uniref:DUF221-domain-containing protein n=1 Tax=Schizophyllum amplum TaxID=97359 RepID=A0A550C932_9AGAR|nr:hypothetical protein BD626DRAFT_406026 [Auriculariopsis ampla]
MSASADKAASSTDTSFVTALVVNAALLAVEVGAFIILKQRLERIYYPRTFLPPPEKRSNELPKGVFGWLPALLRAPTADIIQKNGLDAYMFIRFLRLLVIIFFVFMVSTAAVLMPVDNVGVSTGNKGLKTISWENIGDDDRYSARFAAHIILAYILSFFVLYMLRREMNHFVRARHQFLLSEAHQCLPQSRTVLITAVPDELASEQAMRTFASFIPGGVDRVWLYRDTRALNKLFEERQKACKKLEGAESKLLRLAVKAWHKRQTQHQKLVKKDKKSDPESMHSDNLEMPPPSVDLLNELVPANKRPHHRTGFLGLLGKKVDSVEYWKFDIDRLNKEIDILRADSHTKEFKGSAFVRCNLQMGAHILAQCVSHHEPLKMTEKWMEAHPKDIVWANLDDGPVEVKVRKTISWVATIALIIFWAVPVAFVGAVSNISGLCTNVSWLAWICTIPSVPLGIIEGILPPVLLALLFALLPKFLRFLAWYSCLPRYSIISTNVYKRYFMFLVIHGFIIVTLSSGIVNAIQDIVADPTSAVSALATKLPGASIFFLTYIITQGLAGAGGALAQLVPIVMYFIKKRLLGSTPRQTYGIMFLMPSADFGTLMPRMSLIATIGFSYSILTPLINAAAFVSFLLFFIAYKFLFMQVYDQPEEVESGGLYFPMAISNLFVGLYIEQVVLAILFFLKIGTSKISSIIEGVLMIILIIVTIMTHSTIRNAYARTSCLYFGAISGLTRAFSDHELSADGHCD